ncbi:hypothetical protein HF289_10620 [Acidithiobacillus ferrooxidans]|uniref:hypothetical protein n=1 Tax=Acidithiobacillus ferrooxidans TaxID=920 RepID=UPI001C06BF77|nr:hypothetical protein [Acidithiobacillus ferrooxidans]MBU2857298.1 hypothetical protein [Acidithiobacillus ferrooxidans]
MRKFSGPSSDYGTKSSKLIRHLGKTAWLITRHDGSQYAQPVFQGTTQFDPFARPLFKKQAPTQAQVVKPTPMRAPRRTRQRGASSRASAASGDGNSEDPEPERRPQASLSLYDQASLADLLCISKKSVQNIFSKTPWLLPPAIQIPGARGPRWTPESVQEWLNNRPRHTPKPIPAAPKRKVGRPRIAPAVKGVQS